MGKEMSSASKEILSEVAAVMSALDANERAAEQLRARRDELIWLASGTGATPPQIARALKAMGHEVSLTNIRHGLRHQRALRETRGADAG